jgi:GNAT superfamily N-acetyltransferase
MTEITVRLANTADTAAIVALNGEVQALHAAAMPDFFKAPDPDSLASTVAAILAERRSLVLLAEFVGRPVGYLYAEFRVRGETAHHYGANVIYLHHLSVTATHRRRGIGAALMAALRSRAAERNVARIALDVWLFNRRARAFFKRQGFTPYSQHMWSRM